jgi:transcription elongation factor Elf1
MNNHEVTVLHEEIYPFLKKNFVCSHCHSKKFEICFDDHMGSTTQDLYCKCCNSLFTEKWSEKIVDLWERKTGIFKSNFFGFRKLNLQNRKMV